MQTSINRALVVGLGSIGRRHVRVLKILYPDLQIVLLRHNQCDGKEIEKLGVYHCVTTVKDALLCKPEIAIVASPATKHIEIATELASAGVHLLIEKPISGDSCGIKKLIGLCCRMKITLMVAYNMRFMLSLKEFQKLLEKEKIGKIYSVHSEVGQYLPTWRPNTDYRKGVSARRDLGGGVLLELSHELDYLIWLFGPIKWVMASVSKKSDLEINVEDTASVLMGLTNHYGDEISVTLNMDFIRHDTVRQCIAIGKKGTLRWSGITQQVHFFPKGGRKWEMLFSQKEGPDDTYMAEIKHFWSCVEKNQSPFITGEDGLNVIKVIEKIHQSQKEGRLVYV
jgi:predicted dehydrogenase